MRKVLTAVIAAAVIGAAGCGEDSKKAPAQNAAPTGDQTIGNKDEKPGKGKGEKGRQMPAPPPIEKIK